MFLQASWQIADICGLGISLLFLTASTASEPQPTTSALYSETTPEITGTVFIKTSEQQRPDRLTSRLPVFEQASNQSVSLLLLWVEPITS